MNVYIFSYHTNNFKILWKSSDTIESVVLFFWFVLRNIIQLLNIILFFFNFSVTQVTNQPYSIYSISPASGHASKGRFKTRKSRDSANTTLTTNFFYLTREKKYLCSEQLKQPFYSLIHSKMMETCCEDTTHTTIF